MQVSECTPGKLVTIVNGPLRFNGTIYEHHHDMIIVTLVSSCRKCFMAVYPEYLQEEWSGGSYEGPVSEAFSSEEEMDQYQGMLHEYFAEQLRKQRDVVKSMTTKGKINLLVGWCRASVNIGYNDHRTSYATVEEHFDDSDNMARHREEIPDEVFAEMVKTDTVIRLQFYPNTPIGFYVVFHHDLTMAVDAALSTMFDEREKSLNWDRFGRIN